MAIDGKIKFLRDPTDNSIVLPKTMAKAVSMDDGTSVEAKLSGVCDLIYPVGSIYMSINATNPSTLFGGTWSQLKDRFLLGCGDIYSNGDVGGEATHTLVADEIPNNVSGSAYSRISSDLNNVAITTSEPHNNMPPYLRVYMWKRIG